MNIVSSISRSLILTALLSFLSPILLVGTILTTVLLVSYIPGIESSSQAIIVSIVWFLGVFGTGSPIAGLLIIGFTCGIVGGLFNLYTLSRYQKLRGH